MRLIFFVTALALAFPSAIVANHHHRHHRHNDLYYGGHDIYYGGHGGYPSRSYCRKDRECPRGMVCEDHRCEYDDDV